MTNEKRYELVCKMMREYGKRDNRGIWDPENMIRDPFGAYHTQYGKPYSFEPFYEAATELLRDALSGISEQSTSKTVAAAVKHILDHAPDSRPTLKTLHKVWYNGADRYCACDSYRAVRLNHDITALPHAKDDDPDYFDINTAFKLDRYDELHLPTVQELKATIAAHPELKPTKRFHGVPGNLDGKIGVNATYLLKMLQALPGCRAWMTGRNGAGAPYAPIYFEAETGDGILCPVYQKRDLSTYVTI